MAETQITEKYEFLTDIITSYTGAEQRVALRDVPRHYVTYDYDAMNELEAQWLRALLRMRQSNAMYIPMWHRRLYLADWALKDNKSLILTEGSMYDLRGCSALIIFSKDSVKGSNGYFMLESIRDGGIVGLGASLKSDLNPKNAWIFPMINCSIQPTTGLNYIYSNGAHTTVNLEDLLDMSPVTVPANYMNFYRDYKGRNIYHIPYSHNGEEVLTIRPQWVDDSSVSMDIGKVTTKLDNTTGIFQYDSKNNLSYDKTTYSLTLMCKEEIDNMIKFFHKLKGRCKSFYMPSWVNDFTPCFDIRAGQNIIYTEFDTIYTYYLSNTRKKKIIIFTNNYHSYILGIMSLSYEMIDGEKYGKMILSTPVSVNLPLNNIKMISYFNHVRLDDDTLQLNYESTQVAQVDITTKEVDDV